MKRLIGYIPIFVGNTIPLIGALFWEWNAWQIIFIYWAESVIIAFFGVLKSGVCGFYPLSAITVRAFFENIFFMLVFIVFFMGFLFVIGGILYANMSMFSDFSSSYNPFWPESLSFNVRNFINSPLFGVFGFFLSQLSYFIKDFLVRGEYKKAGMEKYLGEPMKRIAMMHLAALIGGWFIVSRFSANPPNYIFFIWIGLKLFLDSASYSMTSK